MGWYLFVCGVFTLFMFSGTLRANMGTKFVSGSAAVRFFLLALRDWLGSNTIGNIGGSEGDRLPNGA